MKKLKASLLLLGLVIPLSQVALSTDQYTIVRPPFDQNDYYPLTNQIAVPSKNKIPQTSWIGVDLENLPSFNSSEVFDTELGLKEAIEHCMLSYEGSIKSSMDRDVVEQKLMTLLDMINLGKWDSVQRMTLLEKLVMSGCVKAVKKLTDSLVKDYREELDKFCDIMKEDGATSERPIFWLAAIVTPRDLSRVPKSNYQDIEKYLCNILCPTNQAFVNGVTVTRDQYVEDIKKKKQKESARYWKKNQ